MNRDSAEAMTDRDLLVDMRVVVGILEDRTEGLPDLRQRVTGVEHDMGWLKKIVWAIVVPGTIALGGILLKLFR